MRGRLSGRTLVIATGHDLSLALLEDGGLLAETDLPLDRGHAEALMPAIADLLGPFGGPASGIGRIVVETGPGSFTGLRVGVAAARALGLAWGAEVAGVRSTQLVAAASRATGEEGPLFVALAAPRGQVWTESFGAGALDGEGPIRALPPAGARAAVAAFPGARVVGSAAPLLGASGPALRPRAAALVGVADSHLSGAEPLYVRAGSDVAAA
jgi:tRNA threonylcarbamoyl adenosine modification protein YeaZ